MTLATTCTRCKTSFKVVSDQLKLRRGMVRCGVCQNVFNGLEQLKYVEPSGGSRPATAPTSSVEAQSPIADGAQVAEPEQDDGLVNDTAPTATPARVPASLASWPNVSNTPKAITSRAASSIEKAFGGHDQDIASKKAERSKALEQIEHDERQNLETKRQANANATAWSVPPAVASDQTAKLKPTSAPPSRGVAQNTTTLLRQDNDLQTAFFLPDRFEADELARSISPPRSITIAETTPAARTSQNTSDTGVDFFSSDDAQETTQERTSKTGTRIAVAALCLLILLQVTLLLRNVIAQRFPSVRYPVELVAGAVGLPVTLPRDLGKLTIESFDVQATARPDILAISAIIRNRANYPVSWPALELTLTGVDGNPVLRKVIPPAEFLPTYLVNNGASAQTEHPIRIGLQTNSIAPTGFSVNLYYLN
jgi:predicted Zn finger-like uncharacterized protein